MVSKRHGISLSNEEIRLLVKCLRYYVKHEVDEIPIDLRKEPFQILRLIDRLERRPRHRHRFYRSDARELLAEIKG